MVRSTLPTLTDSRGEARVLGCLPRKVRVGSLFPLLSERADPIPRSKWPKTSLEEFQARARQVGIRHNQKSIGMCASAASTHVTEETRRRAKLASIGLSPGDLYRRVSGGVDRGSTLSDNLLEVLSNGIAPTSACPELEWKREKRGAREAARKYRGLEALDAPSFDLLATGSLLDFDGIYGILIGDQFEPDANGVITHGPSGRTGGHAMMWLSGLGAVWLDGEWFAPTLNSWDPDWGFLGCGLVPEAYFTDTPFTDGWNLRLVVEA